MNRTRYHHPLVVVTALILLVIASGCHCFLTNYRGLDVVGLCSGDMRKCSCKSYTGSESEIDCPGDDPAIQVRIELLQYAEVRCRRKRPHDMSQLPRLAIGETKRLTIDYCPLAANRSILEQLDFLGVGQVKLLSLKNNANGTQLERNHFRGLEPLDRLTISNVKLDGVLPDLFDYLPNLTWLDLRESVTKLPASVFHTLPNLRILDLSLNGIQELLPGQLEKLGELRLLSLWRNELTNLTRHVFTGLHQLERLDLSANKLEQLPGQLFAGLPNLTELALSNNWLRALPNGLFQANRALKKVKLAFQQTTLDTVPYDLFQNLPALEHVDLEHTGLANLPNGVFHGSANIRELSLAANQLQSLPEELLRDQRELRMLDLRSNQLTALPPRLLQDTVELRVLRLSQNRLTKLSAELLRSLEKLEQLYLNDNQLHTIGLYCFRSTPNLQTLHLQHNQLMSHSFSTIEHATEADGRKTAVNNKTETETETEMEVEQILVQDGTAFQYLHNLRDLDLSHNHLSTVFHDLLVNMHNLERLNLTDNNITSLTAANLQFLSREVLVDLERNRIFEINLADIEQLMEAQQESEPATLARNPVRILLNDNPLNCNCIVYTLALYLQHRLSDQVYERLQLVADRLTCQGPEQLHGMLVRELRPTELLCELDTPSTRIRHCPAPCNCFVRPADRGVVVKCNGQGLSQIPILPNPSSFGYRFIELHVENNNLTELKAAAPTTGNDDGWSSVQELYASNNSIEKLSPAQLPYGLRVLELTRNKLTHLTGPLTDWMAQSVTLTTIRLAQNEWVCGCETASFLAFARSNHHQIEDFGRMMCADGRAFDTAVYTDLCPTESETAVILLVCGILLLVASLVALVSLLYYNYHLELKVWLFRHGLCLVVEDELDQDKQYDAFLSYSHKDESFVTEHLLPVLERHPLNFKLCWHMRDWIPGEMITSQILSSVEKSRRTIIVLSSNFLASLWGQLEFRAAHLQSLNERRNRVIIIIYDDIGSIDDLEPEMRAYLKTNTYVRWGDPWFWDKVRYAMPHPPRAHTKGTNGGGGLFVRKLQGSVDDKLELIKPTTTAQSTAMPADAALQPSPQPSIPSEPHSNGSVKATVSPLPPHQAIINPSHYQQQQWPHLLIPASGHINGAFLINSNAKQSDV